jgi:hypothetical protein
MIVAIDFTASNKPSDDPTSLHYIDPSGQLNDYQHCISSVGAILNKVDTDKQVFIFVIYYDLKLI